MGDKGIQIFRTARHRDRLVWERSKGLIVEAEEEQAKRTRVIKEVVVTKI